MVNGRASHLDSGPKTGYRQLEIPAGKSAADVLALKPMTGS